MGLEQIMEDKKIISMKRIMEDLVNKKNDGISKELWMMKKKRWVWDELWKIWSTKTKKPVAFAKICESQFQRII